MARDYYKILIVGPSGKGKTFTFRTLDPETTGYVNVENKPLPFKNEYKYHTKCTTLGQAKSTLKEYAENPKITAIVFDSFSAYVDLLLSEARKSKKGFEIWNYYNEEIGKILNYIKTIEKEVMVTAHYEWLQDEGGTKERRTKVKGKEWEGLIEKEFTIVMYADDKFNRDTKRPDYYLSTYEEKSSCKCPPGIFEGDPLSIPNDGKYIIDSIVKFAS